RSCVRLFVDNRKLQALLHGVDAVEEDSYALTDAKAASPAFADDFAGVFAEGVVVVVERAKCLDGHEAFDEEVGELDKESVLGGAEDHGVEVLTDAVTHELHLFPLDELALGVGGAAFGFAAFGGDEI